MLDHFGTALSGIGKWFLVGAVSGMTYAGAVLEGNPEVVKSMTPDLNTSIIGLIMAVIAFVMRSYVPSEKQVTGHYEILRAGHQTLTGKLVELATDSKEQAKETRVFRQDISRWMGTIDGRLSGINERFDRMESRLDEHIRHV